MVIIQSIDVPQTRKKKSESLPEEETKKVTEQQSRVRKIMTDERIKKKERPTSAAWVRWKSSFPKNKVHSYNFLELKRRISYQHSEGAHSSYIVFIPHRKWKRSDRRFVYLVFFPSQFCCLPIPETTQHADHKKKCQVSGDVPRRIEVLLNVNCLDKNYYYSLVNIKKTVAHEKTQGCPATVSKNIAYRLSRVAKFRLKPPLGRKRRERTETQSFARYFYSWTSKMRRQKDS